jgi:hypothetical protein
MPHGSDPTKGFMILLLLTDQQFNCPQFPCDLAVIMTELSWAQPVYFELPSGLFSCYPKTGMTLNECGSVLAEESTVQHIVNKGQH